jgi:hypothetical protein
LAAVLALATAGGSTAHGRGIPRRPRVPGEFLALFRVQFVVAAAVLAGIAGTLRLRWIALIAAVLAGLNAVAVLPALLADGRPDPASPRLRLLVANVWYPGNDYARLGALVERERPDVIGPHGADPRLGRRMAPYRRAYPYRLMRAQPGAFGVGLTAAFPSGRRRSSSPPNGGLQWHTQWSVRGHRGAAVHRARADADRRGAAMPAPRLHG